MQIFPQISIFDGGKCAVKHQDMKWIEIALKYCTLTLISSLEQKRIFNVKYEIVLCTPYSKARWGGPNGLGNFPKKQFFGVLPLLEE